MTVSRRLARATSAVVAVATLIGAVCCWASPIAQAFYIQNHDSITRTALPADQVSDVAVLQILNGPPPGGGAMGSDSFATDQWRHIDNAKNPADICARAQQAWNIFVPVILGGSQPLGPGATVLANRPPPAPRSVAWRTRSKTSTHTRIGSRTTSRPGSRTRLAPPHLPVVQSRRLPGRSAHRILQHPVLQTISTRRLSPGRPAARISRLPLDVEQGRPRHRARQPARSRDQHEHVRPRGEPGHHGDHRPVRAGAHPRGHHGHRKKPRRRWRMHRGEIVPPGSVGALRRVLQPAAAARSCATVRRRFTAIAHMCKGLSAAVRSRTVAGTLEYHHGGTTWVRRRRTRSGCHQGRGYRRPYGHRFPHRAAPCGRRGGQALRQHVHAEAADLRRDRRHQRPGLDQGSVHHKQ